MARFTDFHEDLKLPAEAIAQIAEDARNAWSRTSAWTVPAELIIPYLDELAAAEGVVRETVPARAQAAPQVPAVYLPPSIRPNGPWLTPCSAFLPRGLTG
jgi:hypothetical protein